MLISACAAYYSIVGLTAIFAAAFWPIVIMGSALEAGKLTAAVWLHLNWARANWWIRTYLVPAVAVLMLITSMGIFGFLSKAHIEQTASSNDVTGKIDALAFDISSQQLVIDNNKKIIAQLDAAVENLLKASETQSTQTKTSNANATQRTAEAATKLRKSQEKERSELQAGIKEASNKVVEIQKQKLLLEQQVKKIEAEVGPIKYVASLMYGDNPGTNTLEKAVRWVIILLVVVFDPLAVVMILAATSGINSRKESEKELDEELEYFFANGKKIAKKLDEAQDVVVDVPPVVDEPGPAVDQSLPGSKKN